MERVAHLADSLSPESRYRLLVDDPRDVVYRSSHDGIITWVSHSVVGILGWEPEALVGTVIDSIVHPDDLPRATQYRAVLRDVEPPTDPASSILAPTRVLTSDGTYRWVTVIAIPVTGADGLPDGFVGRLRDVHDLVMAQEAAKATQELTTSAFDRLLDPLIVMRPVFDGESIVDFEYLVANPAACEYNGMTYDEMIGARLLEINPGNRESGEFAQLVDVFHTGSPLILDNHEYDQELRGGERRFYDLRAVRAADVLVYTWRDVTERRQIERDIAEREDLYRLVTADVTDAVVRYDENGIITWVSPSFERLTGFTSAQVVGQSGMRLLPEDQVPEAEELLHRRVQGTAIGGSRIRMSRVDGSQRWVEGISRPFVRHDGTSDGFVTVLRDVTDMVEAEELRAHAIGHDALTGLAGREVAVARIDRALADLRGRRRFVALLSVGLDRLTTVNQALSYAAGDIVLTTVASRITDEVGDPDLVARVAGDEFVVMLTELRSPAEAASMAERLCSAAQGPITVHEQPITPTVSVGVAIGERGDQSEDLLRQAGLAVRQAKDAGRNRWQFVDPNVAAEAQRRLQIEADLRTLINEQHITPWFQPVVSLADRGLRGYEALVRLSNPAIDLSIPDEFLPVAESTGQIIDIDFAVMQQAMDLLAVSPVQHVAINVAPPTLTNPGYVDRVAECIRTSGVDPQRIRLEVTETGLLGMSPAIGEAMRAVADYGARWYVDDFGTGFSSISHLRDLPVSGLKLDRSFTTGIRNGDRTCIKLAQGLIGLAEGLGLDTVAEGIETEFEAGALLGQGWNLGQGWLFGHPVPASETVR